jgi:hypothetical protein
MSPPPGYIAYGDVGAPGGGGFAAIGGMSKALWILLAIYVPLSIWGIFSTAQQADKARQFLRKEISESTFKNGTGFGGGNIAGVFVIPIAVITIVWMFRMASNLRVLRRSGQRFAPGWAIGGWFTPPCIVYAVPWLMFRELWKGSDPKYPAGDPNWNQAPVSPLVNVWWVLYGLVPLVGLFSSAGLIAQFRNGNANAQDLADRLDKYIALDIGLAVVGVISAVVYLVLVRQLSARHMQATGEA